MSRSMAIAPPPLTPAHHHPQHQPSRSMLQHAPISMNRPQQSSVFPSGGVFGGLTTPSRNIQPPPMTPAHPSAATQSAFTTPHHPSSAASLAPPSTPFQQTPIKQNGHTNNAFQTPTTHTSTPATPAPATSSNLSNMSEADSVKLMAALNQFVLVALQQQSTAYMNAQANGVRMIDAKNYVTLLSQLQAQHSDPLALSRWYAAVSKSVASLHAQHHAELLQFLYNYNYNEAASLRNVEVFINLLVAMCVGGNQIHAIGPALKTLVNSFIATNVPLATISAASVSPMLYGRAGDGSLPSISLGESATPAAAIAAASQFASGGHELPTIDSIHDLVHTALTRIMQLLPSSPTVLFPLLVESFPHKRNEGTIQLIYVKNLLRISEYVPSLRDRILTTIIERMIHIDVEIDQSACDGDEDQDEDELNEDENDLPKEEPDLMFTMSTGEAGASPVAPKKLTESAIMADKLDSLMCLLLEYLRLIHEDSVKGMNGKSKSSSIQTPGSLIAQATQTTSANGQNGANSNSVDLCDEIFSSLLRVFERSILRTHNSRFTQFLLFYYCSFKHVYAETFLKYLMEKGFEVQTSAVERQNSALYIASFVARASFLRHASAIVAFEMLLKWTHAYTEYHIKTTQAQLAAIQQNTHHSKHGAPASSLNVPEVGPLEASQHAVFYRMCQAVFYIFCYRQSSFRDMFETNPEVLQALRFDALIFSPLNPLRYISQSVIDEFLRVNASLGTIVACEEWVQRNHRLNQSSRVGTNQQANGGHQGQSQHHRGSNGETSALGGTTDGSSQTSVRFDPNDIFFPFDPYLLKHSSAYIDHLYINYGEDDLESDSGSDGDDEQMEDDVDEEVSQATSHTNGSNNSKPIKIGANGKTNGTSSRKHTATTTSSPELDASVSSMSASFSEQLSVESNPNGSPAIHAGSMNMSFEMERGSHLPPPAIKVATKKEKKVKEEKKTNHHLKPIKPRRGSHLMATSSGDEEDDSSDEEDHLVLSDKDLSFSPVNSPAFAPLDDSPPIKPKRR